MCSRTRSGDMASPSRKSISTATPTSSPCMTPSSGRGSRWQSPVPGRGQSRLLNRLLVAEMRAGRFRIAALRETSVAWSLPDDCVLGIFGNKPEPGNLPTFRQA